jgi:hypothetical protein
VDLEAPADRKRKAEDKAAEEAKKVRLMEMASPTSEAAPTASSSLASSSSSAPRKSRSLINILMSGHELDVARGYNLF